MESAFAGMIDTVMGVCNQVFGFKVTYYFKSEPDGFDVDGIFDAAGLVVDTSGDIPVESRKPVLCIRKSDFIRAGHRLPRKGDTVSINGTIYEVTKAPGEDDGWSEMRLVMMKKGQGTYA